MNKLLRGIRGAITIDENSKELIVEASEELLSKMIDMNRLNITDIASIFFTTTKDLNAEYPAVAARNKGLLNVALLCTHEMEIPQGLSKCLRILIHVNTEQGYNDLKHVYLKGAKVLRPDLLGSN
ncbi:MAG: chorismate mutase [Dehalococcoidia bacterium]|jgi:chorismate mutase|nr:MAG: chorismate mutase [Chloroflexota bacterium]|tara:strand:+ start:235 stop:609 length:375 start_codon:yes stop_codon:yes gene_type:complete